MSASITTAITVTGMTCGHCTAAVQEELMALSGVEDVHIDLVAGGDSTVTISSQAALDPQEIAAAVDEAGYEVRS